MGFAASLALSVGMTAVDQMRAVSMESVVQLLQYVEVAAARVVKNVSVGSAVIQV